MITKEKTVQITYYTSEETRTKLRILAAKTGVNQTAIIEEAVQAYLKKQNED